MEDTFRKLFSFVFMLIGGLGALTFILSALLLLFSGHFSIGVLLASLFLTAVCTAAFLIGYYNHSGTIRTVEMLLPKSMKKTPSLKQQETPEPLSNEPAEEFLASLLLKDLWTIISHASSMPYSASSQNDTVLLYTKQEDAERMKQEGLSVLRIPDENKKQFFGECIAAGYDFFLIADDQEYRCTSSVPEKVFSLPKRSEYGIIHPELCREMRTYRQKESDDTETRITEQLKNAVMMITDDCPDYPCSDGTALKVLFTDRFALKRYTGRTAPDHTSENLLRETYEEIKNDDHYSGIIINPGREEYIFPRSSLEKIFDESVI